MQTKTAVQAAVGAGPPPATSAVKRVRRRGRARRVAAEKYRTRRSEGGRERWSSRKEGRAAATVAERARMEAGREREGLRAGTGRRKMRWRRWEVRRRVRRDWRGVSFGGGEVGEERRVPVSRRRGGRRSL